MKRILIIVIVLIFTQLSCQFFEGPEPEWGPSFRMVVIQGFSGWPIDTISVDSYGTLTSWDGIYDITVKTRMSRASYDSLVRFAQGMDTMKESYGGAIMDDGEYHVERWTGSSHTSVWATVSSIWDVSDSQHLAPAPLRSMILLLREQGSTAVEALKTWSGVDSRITLQSDRYLVGDSVRLTLVLTNSTPVVRTFPHFVLNAQIRPDDSPITRGGWWSIYYSPVTHDSSLFKLQPYEQKAMPFALGTSTARHFNPLIPGEYVTTASLFPSNSEVVDTFRIEVVDPGCPIGGAIHRYAMRFDDPERRVTFKLMVRNLLAEPFLLEFQNTQKILVELFDFTGDTVGMQEPFFSGPTDFDGLPSTLLLQPGQSDTLTYTTFIDSLHTANSHNTLRIRLLQANVTFARTGYYNSPPGSQ